MKNYSPYLLALAAFLVVVGGVFAFQKIKQSTTSEKTQGEQVACTQQYEPVCGVDKKTYPNRCVAEKQNKVKVDYEGPCKQGSAAPKSGLQVTSPCTGVSTPVCGVDGKNYASQCLADFLGVKVKSQGMCPLPVIKK